MKRRWVLTGVLIASLGAACQLDHHLSPPPDAHVDAGPWTAHVELGEPGWRQSSTPWEHEGYYEAYKISLWSHPDALYVYFWYGEELADGTQTTRDRMWMNAGTGWQVHLEGGDYYQDALQISRLRGFPGGLPIGAGDDDDRALVKSLPSTGATVALSEFTHDLFVVSDTLAYALGSELLFRFDGSSWSPIATPLPRRVRRIWADSDVVIAVGDDGALLRYQDDTWSIVDTRITDHFLSIWAFSSSDVWIGGLGGKLWHFDGTTLTEPTWPNPFPGGDQRDVRNLWGTDGVLYVAAGNVLARWEGGVFERIAHWGCPTAEWETCPLYLQVQDLWGNGPDEVFIAVSTAGAEVSQWQRFGPVHLLRWDGVEFHWF